MSKENGGGSGGASVSKSSETVAFDKATPKTYMYETSIKKRSHGLKVVSLTEIEYQGIVRKMRQPYGDFIVKKTDGSFERRFWTGSETIVLQSNFFGIESSLKNVSYGSAGVGSPEKLILDVTHLHIPANKYFILTNFFFRGDFSDDTKFVTCGTNESDDFVVGGFSASATTSWMRNINTTTLVCGGECARVMSEEDEDGKILISVNMLPSANITSSAELPNGDIWQVKFDIISE